MRLTGQVRREQALKTPLDINSAYRVCNDFMLRLFLSFSYRFVLDRLSNDHRDVSILFVCLASYKQRSHMHPSQRSSRHKPSRPTCKSELLYWSPKRRKRSQCSNRFVLYRKTKFSGEGTSKPNERRCTKRRLQRLTRLRRKRGQQSEKRSVNARREPRSLTPTGMMEAGGVRRNKEHELVTLVECTVPRFLSLLAWFVALYHRQGPIRLPNSDSPSC